MSAGSGPLFQSTWRLARSAAELVLGGYQQSGSSDPAGLDTRLSLARGLLWGCGFLQFRAGRYLREGLGWIAASFHCVVLVSATFMKGDVAVRRNLPRANPIYEKP